MCSYCCFKKRISNVLVDGKVFLMFQLMDLQQIALSWILLASTCNDVVPYRMRNPVDSSKQRAVTTFILFYAHF